MTPYPRKLASAEHLMVLPVPMRLPDGPDPGGRILFEQQACHGLERWCDSFESLYVAAPVLPENEAARRTEMAWTDVREIPTIDRIEMIPLPRATSMRGHLRHVGHVRQTLRALIERSTYLHFGIGNLFGGWANIACEEAIRLNRPYAVHLDIVEHELLRRTAAEKSLPRRVKSLWMAGRMQKLHRRLIERSALLLCHGSDTYAAYGPLNRNAHLIHNIHTSAGDQATADQARAKAIAAASADEPLSVIYAGRMAPQKAPLDWLRALHHAIVGCGADLRATWLGEGPLRDQMEQFIRETHLEDRISLPGFTRDRQQLLATVRASHVFLFTHITPESPRCLIEALVCATPIVGYDSRFPADLIAHHQGGRLTPMGDWRRLGETLAELARDRARLTALFERARADGQRFTSEAVFRERSELIKTYLSPGGARSAAAGAARPVAAPAVSSA